MGNVEIPNWLKNLPLAPTFYPTDTEFADPIAYISKIEKQASAFGICKVVPPLPKPSKKFVFSNLNKSLLKSPELDSSSLSSSHLSFRDNEDHPRAVFTTRHQELGCSSKKIKPGVPPGLQSVYHKQVWQSGEAYTLEQFESKAKSFSRSQLGMFKEVTPLVVEALFWKAASEKPIYIEYANDVPGSAFGEPEEVCQYFHRRRKRRRQFDQSCRQRRSDDFRNAGASRNSYIDSESASEKHDFGSPTLSTVVSEESSKFKRQKSLNSGNDREGTAGWKLSNSPWNLQVISRSPGSLTRFMLDDIPGVTSPMIYIGMLFSWFAWHVEDHELHSLNFLHTGSSKTWYAVPGDYAFRFEEVIRSKGYGGDLDPLAALTLLGEKTNLLSPEVVISSGIPCCRLEQSPGEFVVTFPRAYHIGFSHGFNCGEAANFGTPQWLTVAKAAAVRRAAMNYLPMLSHQQLLYMLTMSFVSRVPRALLPGVRTSRLKDRQKEERELLVKKAFIDDMFNEENRLAVLLEKESTFSAVLWDPDALRFQESVSSETSTVSAMPTRRTSVDYKNNDGCNDQVDLTRVSVEMEDIHMDDDDLPCGLLVDSGALACVACGVLGFPFMSIIQPSSRASEELFPADPLVTQGPEVLESVKSNALSDSCNAVMESASDARYCNENAKVSSGRQMNPMIMENSLWKFYTDAISKPPEATVTTELKGATSHTYSSNVVSNYSMYGNSCVRSGEPLHSANNSHKQWITDDGFLRPRIFCLEHALEIEELLHSKGGANVLIICHSAYQKIKAHASVVAEEIGTPFDCDKVPLHCASKEDIDLINISIDNDEHEQGREDWTSRLGLNLRDCAKLRKQAPSKQGQHALFMRGLFADMFSSLDHSSLKWKSRRSRTPYKVVGQRQLNSCVITQIEKIDVVKNIDRRNAAGENKILQYSRRGCSKAIPPLPSRTEHCVLSQKDQLEDVFTDKGVLVNNIPRGTLCSTENNGNIVELNKSLQNKPSIFNSGMQLKDCTDEVSRDMDGISDSPRFAGCFSTKKTESDITKGAKSLAVESSEMQLDSCNIVKTNGTGEVSDHVKCATVLGRQGVLVSESSKARGVSDYTVSVGSLAIPCSDVGAMGAPLRGERSDEQGKGGVEYNSKTVDSCKMQHISIVTNEKCEVKSDPNKFPSSGPTVITCSEIETRTLKEGRVADEFCNNMILDASEMQVVCKATDPNCKPGVCGLTKSMAQASMSSVLENSEKPEFQSLEETIKRAEVCSSAETSLLEDSQSTISDSQSMKRKRSKRRRELDQVTEDENSYSGFIKSPCEGLRPRRSRMATCDNAFNVNQKVETVRKEAKRASNSSVTSKAVGLHKCGIEGCRMSFKTREQLNTHQSNRCTHKGCGKRFSSHRYAMLHQRVHVDERPLKCPWEGCAMSFKWSWARTEHLRVHTGERPYHCNVEGCGLTFRFVSDFSRHRRKSGHNMDS